MSPQAPSQSTSHADAAEALAPEAGLFAELDPVLFGRALASVGAGLARHPLPAVRAGTRFATRLLKMGAGAAIRAAGGRGEGEKTSDRRFADPAWEHNALFFAVREAYLGVAAYLQELVDAAALDQAAARKARFVTQFLVDAAAPTNFLPTNPAALKRAFDTGGTSVLRGLGSFLDDLVSNGGRPRQVDTSPFKLGENLAATPGKVVYRSGLMELIQYAPQTPTVHEVPLLASPPWINKYYIMDLSPGRSFIEWAVQHGHTVFAISYRNPDASMRDVRMDDYLIDGPRTAIEVIGDITGAPQVNIVGLCLGGTLTMMLLAYLDAVGDDRVRSATLLNTLVDFSEPGALGIFTDVDSVARLERKMARTGHLEATSLATTFDALRANDLIWSYVVTNWLMGEQPPAFDILAWNADSTRMPAKMHAFYLRSCYISNQLARGELELAGERLRLDEITQDVFLVAAERDHIVPWRSAYKAIPLLPKADVRFVLSSSGHIAGIVNPPSPKARHWIGSGGNLLDPDTWREHATQHQGSWWEPWAAWIGERAGTRRKPPPMGSATHPPLADAPGGYIHER